MLRLVIVLETSEETVVLLPQVCVFEFRERSFHQLTDSAFRNTEGFGDPSTSVIVKVFQPHDFSFLITELLEHYRQPFSELLNVNLIDDRIFHRFRRSGSVVERSGERVQASRGSVKGVIGYLSFYQGKGEIFQLLATLQTRDFMNVIKLA